MSNYSADQIALQSHIRAENARTQAWIDEAEGRWAGMVTDSLEHWADYGITSVEGYQHYMLVESYIDFYKSENGIKPRWMNFDEMSLAELQAEWDSLAASAKARQEEQEEYRAKEAAEAARLAEELGVSLETYNRWQEEAYGVEEEENW